MIKLFRDLLTKNKLSLFRSGIIVMVGIFSGKAVTVLLTPILTEIYSPEDFGNLAFMISAGNILTIIFTFKYEIVLLSKKNNEINQIIKLLITQITLFAIILSSISLILYYINIFEDIIYILIPIYSFILGLYSIYRWYSVKEGRFINISKSEISKNGLGSLLAIFGYLFYFPFGLIIGELIAKIYSIKLLKTKDIIQLDKISVYLSQIKPNFKYMLKTGTASIINIVNMESVQLFVFSIYDAKAAGIFFLSKRMVAVPLTLLATSAGDIINNRLSHYRSINYSIKKIKNNFYKIITILVVISLFLMLLIYSFIDTLVDMFFSSKFTELSIVVKYLIPYYFALLVIKPISNFFLVLEKYNYNILWDMLRLILLLLLYISTIYFQFEFYTFLPLVSIILFSGYFIYPIIIAFSFR